MLTFTFQTIKQTSKTILLLNPVWFTDVFTKNIKKKTLDIDLIFYRLNDGHLLFQTNSDVLKTISFFPTTLVSFTIDINKEGVKFTLQIQD